MKNYAISIFTLYLLLTQHTVYAMDPNVAKLSESYVHASNYDAQLKLAQANYRANAELSYQQKSQLLPQLSAMYSLDQQHSDEHSTGKAVTLNPLSGQLINIPVNNQQTLHTTRKGYSVQLQQPIIDLHRWHLFKASRAELQSVELELLESQQQLIQRLCQAYFNTLQARALLSSSAAEEKALQEQLKRTTLHYDNGLLSITEIHEAEAARDLAHVQYLRAQNEYQTALSLLRNITGQHTLQPKTINGDFAADDFFSGHLEQWVNDSLNNNLQLNATRQRIASAKENVDAKQAASLPTLNAKLNFNNYDAEQYSHSFNTQIDQQLQDRSISLELKLPLYTGGYLNSQKRQALAELDRVYYRAQQLQRDIEQQVKTLFLHLTMLEQGIYAQETAVKSSESALKTTQFGFDNGTRTFADVLRAQSALYDAQRQLADVRYTFLNTWVDLKKTAGDLSERDLQLLDSLLFL